MLRKQVFFSAIFFLFSSVVWAQGLTFGIKAGVDLAKPFIHFKQNETFKLKEPKPFVGFNLNGIVEYRTSTKFGVTLEPGFIQKGFVNNFGKGDVAVKLNYWQIPLLFDYHTTEKWAVSIGPEIAFFKKISANDLHESVELSGVFGVSYRLVDHFEVGLKVGSAIAPSYNVNFTGVNGADDGKYTEYNQYAQVSIAYKI